jgi:hypothetical protein
MRAIPLTRGYQALVDNSIFDRLIIYNWHVVDYHIRMSYAQRWIPGIKNPRKASRMHHEVLGIDPNYLRENNLVVDHEDRDGLNNQEYNLRIVTRRENALNSERADNALGIYWDTVRGQYKVMELQPAKRFIAWCKTLDEALIIKGFA